MKIEIIGNNLLTLEAKNAEEKKQLTALMTGLRKQGIQVGSLTVNGLTKRICFTIRKRFPNFA